MSLTEDITGLVQAANSLTQEVSQKMSEIDQRTAAAEQNFEQWKADTPFIHQYLIATPEYSNETQNHHLIKLYSIENSTLKFNPLVYIGYTGSDVVGNAIINSLTQTLGYTDNVVLAANKGNGTLKFFIEKDANNNGNFYVAIQNSVHNNAQIIANITANIKLDVESLGAVNIAQWQNSNPSIAELSVIDLIPTA